MNFVEKKLAFARKGLNKINPSNILFSLKAGRTDIKNKDYLENANVVNPFPQLRERQGLP